MKIPRKIDSGRASRAGIAALAGLLLTTGCLHEEELQGCGIPATSASPRGGLFPENEDTTITLESDRPATIYFTLDGTPPRVESANCRNGPTFCGQSPVSNIPVAYNGMFLQYFAVDQCGNQEQAKSQTYRLDTAPNTQASPPCGLYNKPVEVVLTASDESTAPATVYYTTSGANPDPVDPATQSGPSPLKLTISSSSQLKWRSEDATGNLEQVRSCQYTIDTIPPISEAQPGSCTDCESPLDITIRITNDTGTVYWTTNGAVPTPNDPQGHTQSASLQKTITIDQSTILRFTSVDKAGNTEQHSEASAPYNQETYIIDNRPAIVATPPGGTYAEETLTIALTSAPSNADKSWRTGPGTWNTYDEPFTISGQEVDLEIRAQQGVASRTVTETYELGVGGTLITIDDQFDNADNINGADSTARVANGKVVIPELIRSQVDNETNSTIQLQAVGTSWHRQILFDPDVDASRVMLIDGADPFGLGGGNTESDAEGLKTYTWNRGSETMTYGSVEDSGTGEVFQKATILQDTSGRDIAVISTVQGGTNELVSFDISSGTPVELDRAAIVAGNAFPPGLVAQKALTGMFTNNIFVTRQDTDTDSKTFVRAYTLQTSDDTIVARGEVSLPTSGAGVDALSIAMDPGSLGNDIFVLDSECRLWEINFIDIDNPAAPSDRGIICPDGEIPGAMVAAQIYGFAYVYIVHWNATGTVNASIYDVFQNDTYKGVLPAGQRPDVTAGPQQQGWSVGVVHNEATDADPRPLLAVAGGEDGVWLYDLTLPATTQLTALDNFGNGDGQVHSIAIDDTVDSDRAYLLLSIKDINTGTAFSDVGGATVWRIDDQPTTAFAKSKQLNAAGTSVQSMKLLDANFTGDVTIEFVAGSTVLGTAEVGDLFSIDPAATAVYWQATLDESGGTAELDSIQIRLGQE